MGDTTIEWTDKSWNPVRGCSEVGPDCANCYAKHVAARFSGPGLAYEGLARFSPGRRLAQWTGVVRLVAEHLGDPLRWRDPQVVFVNSMSDLFHEDLPFPVIAAVFGVMGAAERHSFQVLTKRPEVAARFFAWLEEQRRSKSGAVLPHGLYLAWAARKALEDASEERLASMVEEEHAVHWPLRNVGLGVSAGYQEAALERVPHLFDLPAAWRFVSYEPAIGEITWSPAWLGGKRGLDWVIVGGESGEGARPFDVRWARSTIAACRERGVRVFVKQMGSRSHDGDRRSIVDARGVAAPSLTPESARTLAPSYAGGGVDRAWLRLRHPKGGRMSEWPEDVQVREYPPQCDRVRRRLEQAASELVLP